MDRLGFRLPVAFDHEVASGFRLVSTKQRRQRWIANRQISGRLLGLRFEIFRLFDPKNAVLAVVPTERGPSEFIDLVASQAKGQTQAKNLVEFGVGRLGMEVSKIETRVFLGILTRSSDHSGARPP